MRIALAQINPTLGDFSLNAKKINDFSRRALERRADVVVFPEASLFGYHPMDLLERSSVVQAQLDELDRLVKKLPKNILVVFGAFTRNKNKKGKPYYNSAVVVYNNRIKFQCAKELLPTYDVFDDARHIQPGNMQKNIFLHQGKKILLTVCEDIWAWPVKGGNVESFYPTNPIKKIKSGSVDLVLNLSASPFHIGKFPERERVVASTVRHLKAPMVYVNMVGGQDELVFDGGSFALNSRGKLISTSVFFQEDLNIVDLGTGEGGLRPRSNDEISDLRQALVLGIRDFAEKVGMKRAHLGLSGGIDSAVVACLAADALGPKNVTVMALPGPYSSEESFSLAKDLAKNLAIEFKSAPISPAYDQVSKSLNETFGPRDFGIVEENIQSRLRGLFLMALANMQDSLLLNTSNKSELASGFGTLYGDMVGGLSPIGDLLKRDVYSLAKFYNRESEIIPSAILSREPTAELRPDQVDEDVLPPYADLDSAVSNLVEKTGVAKTKVEKFLLRALMKSEFKRWQAPPILKVREHSFGRGRRMPVAHRALF